MTLFVLNEQLNFKLKEEEKKTQEKKKKHANSVLYFSQEDLDVAFLFLSKSSDFKVWYPCL